MKLKIFENPVTGEKRVRERRFLYIIFVVGLMIAYSRYLPIIQDLYTARQNVRMNDLINDLYVNPIFKFESILIFCIVAVLYCLIRHLGISILITSVGMFVLTQASYIKYLNRRELFRLDDLKLTEAAGMATSYIEVHLDWYFLALIGFFICAVLLAWLTEKVYKDCFPKAVGRKKWIALGVRGMAAILLITAGVLYYQQFMRSQKSLETVESMSVLDTEGDRYAVYRFLENDSISGISFDNVEASYAFFEEQEQEESPRRDAEDYPNVIVIMNESWWNTDNFPEGRVSFSSDPMAVYRELSKKCSSGYLTSNVYGGGTVSSEAEFLTGLNTKYFVTASGIYEDTKGRKLPTVTDYFNALDYETVAIHPYYGSFYSRDVVYKDMGFDRMIFEDTMDFKDIYSKYISDEAFVQQVKKEFESKGDKKQFIWGVTIANHRRHLPYEVEDVMDYPYPITIQTNMGTLSEGDFLDVTNYVNGIHLANLAYRELVEYFEKQDEPVVLLMFGDHIPNFWPSSLETLGFRHERLSEELVTQMYSVPVLMWTNCSDEKYDFKGENINYISEIMLDMLGMPESPMMRVLRCERNVLKTNSEHRICDADGKIIKVFDDLQISVMNHFKAMQYDILFGENLGEKMWIPEK